MKSKISILFAALMALSFQTFADKVMITGEPVILEQQGGVYSLPKGYTTSTNYYYVTIDGKKRVCYLEKQSTLSALELMAIGVNVNGETVQWSCYPFDETYFEVTP